MKKSIIIVVMLILIATIIVLFFGKIDSAMEIDSLKAQIQLQRKEMRFLQGIMNSGFASCKTTVVDFENAVRANGRDILWQGDDTLVGPFKVKKKDSCIVDIKVVGGI